MVRYNNINGVRVQMTAEEEAARDAEETAWTNGALDRALYDLRLQRNQKLAETDYLALSDNTLASNMATYRQQLRDLTSGLDTVDKINNVTWPTKPS